MTDSNTEADAVREWLAEAERIELLVAAHAFEHDRDSTFPDEGAAAVVASPLNTAMLDGMAWSTFGRALGILARGDAAFATAWLMHQGSALAASKIVDPEQCDAVVSDFRSGAWFATALSEPTGGNLFLSPQQSAERVHGGCRLSGAKRFVTASERARYLWVNALCDGTPKFFIIDKDDSVEVRDVWDTMGMRGTRSQLLRLHGTLLPDARESKISPPNAVAVGLAWISIGLAEAAMRFAVQRSQERVLPPDDTALADMQWVQFAVADMSMQLGASRAFAEHMTAMTDRGDPSMIRLQMEAKTVANEAAISIARAALDIAGGSGYFRGQPIELYLRNAMSGPLMAFSGAAVRNHLGKVLLGRGPQQS